MRRKNREQEKRIARELRAQGWSLQDIQKYFEKQGEKINIGNISRWCRDVELTQSQQQELNKRVKEGWHTFLQLKEEARGKIKQRQNQLKMRLANGDWI